MNLLSKLIKHELVTGSFFIFAGSMASNILAFVLNLFLARSLSYADYAIFSSLSSVIALASIPATSINTIVVKFATDYFVKKESEKLKSFYVAFFKFVIGLSIGIIILSIAFSIPLSSYLKLDNIWYVIISGLVIAAFYLSTLNSGFLQGLLKFKFLSVVTSLGGVFKVITGVLLVVLGYKAFSGIWASLFMALGMFIVALIPLSRILMSKNIKDLKINFGSITAYAIPAFFTVLFLTSFTSIDVILVKHFFPSDLAGYYSGLSLIGKVIFYFTFPIPIVMFPLLIKRDSAGIGFNKLFYLSIILVLMPSLAITAVYFVRPALVINIFLGGRAYLSIAPYLGLFGINLTIFSVINIFVNFFLSLNKTVVTIPTVLFSIIQIVLIYMFHSTFYQVIGVTFLTLCLFLLSLIFIFIKDYTNITKIKQLSFVFGAQEI